MAQEIKTEQGKLVVALRTYTENDWYGDRLRFYYTGPDGQGFKTQKEARKFKGKLKKYVKTRIKGDSRTEIDGDVEIGILENFCTYKYMGAGPSYSCPNIEVKTELIDLLQLNITF
jgi:hypothetical protein